MNNLQTYERIVKAANTRKRVAIKISLILSYLLFFSLWLIFALNNPNIFIPIIIAGALSTFGAFRISWKYIQIEYEYSFCYGDMNVSKIYGKRKRKALAHADIKSLLFIAPATQENINKAEKLEIEERIIAVSSEEADNIWLAVTGDKDEKRLMMFFEADERSLALLKSVNPYAFSKRI